MRVIRILRGIIGTAFAFAVPWAVFGGVLSVVIELVWNGPFSAHPPSYYVGAALSQVAPFAALGFTVGAAFAGFLAVAGRKLAFEQLTATRVLRGGMPEPQSDHSGSAAWCSARVCCCSPWRSCCWSKGT